jgi:hypothetical protein
MYNKHMLWLYLFYIFVNFKEFNRRIYIIFFW